MSPLIVALTLLVTIGAALGFGISLGYAVLGLIFRAMRRERQRLVEPALATAQTSSGD